MREIIFTYISNRISAEENGIEKLHSAWIKENREDVARWFAIYEKQNPERVAQVREEFTNNDSLVDFTMFLLHFLVSKNRYRVFLVISGEEGSEQVEVRCG
ncbi:MAG: hypothetical protein GY757_35215 [bacterium]|nr:hypothetical protein [bacterium]